MGQKRVAVLYIRKLIQWPKKDETDKAAGKFMYSVYSVERED